MHWHASATMAGMSMPETTVNEDRFAQAWDRNVRLAREILAMETVAQPKIAHQLPHG
jgi:hypothetical protein